MKSIILTMMQETWHEPLSLKIENTRLFLLTVQALSKSMDCFVKKLYLIGHYADFSTQYIFTLSFLLCHRSSCSRYWTGYLIKS